jgi:3-oxoacyl-[acyl-carrier-protein] synthase-3
MDGMDVFNFAMRVVPKSIKEIAAATNTTLDDIDYLVFHQANKFMTDFFAKRLKFDMNKVPYCIQKYGNTSSTSVPLTIVSELHDKLKNGDRVVMAGFGAGLSWGTARVVFNNCKISPVVEY